MASILVKLEYLIVLYSYLLWEICTPSLSNKLGPDHREKYYYLIQVFIKR